MRNIQKISIMETITTDHFYSLKNPKNPASPVKTLREALVLFLNVAFKIF